MNRSDARTFAILAIVGFLVGASGVAAFNLATSVPVEGGVPLSSTDNTTVVVEGTTNAQLEDFTVLSGTVQLNTSDGNVSVFSTGNTHVAIHKDDITGEWTNATNIEAPNQLDINPEDKLKISVEGDADTLDFRNPTVDDGEVDFVISGSAGSSDVTVRGLPADTTLTAVNKSGGATSVTTSNSNGVATFTGISHSTQQIQIQSGDKSDTPSQDNASPQGGQSTAPTQFEVDISDSDFPDDDVDVTFFLDGSQVGTTQTISSDQTVTEAIPASGQSGGSHTWAVNATDKFGNVNNITYTYSVPTNLTIREETPKPHELIDHKTIKVTFYENTDDNPTIVNRTTSNGEIDLSGLPIDGEFSLNIRAPGYHNRTVLVTDIFTQNSTFLINKTKTPDTVENRFTVDDGTGNFPDDESQLIVQRAINRSLYDTGGFAWVNVAGDELGASGAFVTDLENETRYRIKVTNDDGDTRILGPYTPEFSGTINLEIGELNVVVPEDDTYAVEAYWESGPENVVFEYNDTTGSTGDIELFIFERGNRSNVIHDTTHNGPFGGLKVTTGVGTQNETAWVVEYNTTRNGENVRGSFVVGPQRTINPGLSDFWQAVGGVAALVIVAGLFGGLRARAGAVAVPLLAGGLWFIGWLPGAVGAGAIILALAMGVIYATTGNEAVPGR